MQTAAAWAASWLMPLEAGLPVGLVHWHQYGLLTSVGWRQAEACEHFAGAMSCLQDWYDAQLIRDSPLG